MDNAQWVIPNRLIIERIDVYGDVYTGYRGESLEQLPEIRIDAFPLLELEEKYAFMLAVVH